VQLKLLISPSAPLWNKMNPAALSRGRFDGQRQASASGISASVSKHGFLWLCGSDEPSVSSLSPLMSTPIQQWSRTPALHDAKVVIANGHHVAADLSSSIGRLESGRVRWGILHEEQHAEVTRCASLTLRGLHAAARLPHVAYA